MRCRIRSSLLNFILSHVMTMVSISAHAICHPIPVACAFREYIRSELSPESHLCKKTQKKSRFILRAARKLSNMHSRAWLAYAVISGPALSATVPKPSQSEDSVSTSSLELVFPGNFSTTTTNASYLNGVPNEDLFSLNTGSQPSFNYSASLYNLPIGYDLPVVTNAVPQCNGAVYGTNLNRHSCFDAWRNTDWAPQRVSWGPRGPGHNFQYRLPYRWTSCKSTTKYQS